jgi:hypothetical protein
MTQEKTLQALHDENERLGLYKDAYAQPEQEPVAYINVEERKLEWAKPMSWNTPTTVNIPKIPLYTTPPQRTWVGIPEQDLKQGDESFFVAWREGARWAEAKLKEKNT